MSLSTKSPKPAVDALLLIGTRCPHCQAALDGLSRLVKEGAIGALRVINVSVYPDAPEVAGRRSVPWTCIGPFEIVGAQPLKELRDWAALAASGGGWGRYFAHLIDSHRLAVVAEQVRGSPHTLTDLLTLFADPDTSLALRIGISAIMESLAGEPVLRAAVPEIASLALSDAPQIRADACYFLGLTGDPSALATVLRLRGDEDPQVREVAADVLDLLGWSATDQAAPG